MNADIERFSCEEYCNTFFHIAAFNSHLRTHKNRKYFIRETCKMAFSRKHHLKQHLVIHTNVKPYICDTCNNAFSLTKCNTSLKKHLCIHTNEKLCLHSQSYQIIIQYRIQHTNKSHLATISSKISPEITTVCLKVTLKNKVKHLLCGSLLPKAPRPFLVRYMTPDILRSNLVVMDTDSYLQDMGSSLVQLLT
ncbi:UNVERIFIED_CONTAM: zinc finger protein [Trichonephila clavipes]